MGEGLAFPIDRFELVRADCDRLSDTRRWFKAPYKEPSMIEKLQKFSSKLGKAAIAPLHILGILQ